MKPDTKIVKIERGQFSPRFQVARALITAGSALVTTEPIQAEMYITDAIIELEMVRSALKFGDAQ
jgi:hypothetical protein